MKRYIRSSDYVFPDTITNTFKSKSEYFNFLNDEYGDDLDMAYGDMCGEVASEAFETPLGVPEIFGKISEDTLYARYISWRKRNGLYCD